MNISEMHREFKIKMDKLDTYGLPGFEPEEIDVLLNEAQSRFIKTRYSADGNRKGKGFEETQKRTDDLRTLVLTLTNQSLTTTVTNERYRYQLPVDYMFLGGKCETTSTLCGTQWTGFKLVQTDDIYRLMEDPFNSPVYDAPLAAFEGNGLDLYSDGTYTVDKINVTYLRQAVKMDFINGVDCELSLHTHNEIVDIAVDIALESIGDTQRYQTHGNETLKQE